VSYPITATAIANCLGTDATAVFDRAFAGTTGFIPAKQVYDVACSRPRSRSVAR
jgi:hypothetical protein